MQDQDRRPECKLIGENGNIFNLMGIASRALRQAGQGDMVNDMQEEVTRAKSYDDALYTLNKYVNII